MATITFIFAWIYPRTVARVGYRYNDAILVPSEANGNTVYSGKIKGDNVQFTVSNGDTVRLVYGDKTYGPYTVKEDVTAIPKGDGMSADMSGIEVREGSEILFRGGVADIGGFYWFCSEDGTSDNMIEISYMTGDGIERDENGNPVDKRKPSLTTIYELVNGPELTHKGEGSIWFGAVFICILNAVSILFADELFRLNLTLRIRDAQSAQPSDWEIAGRYTGWTVMAIMALVLFIAGLQ